MCNRNKPQILGDRISTENSLGIFLTETWLTPEVSNAEVSIDGMSLYRGDRQGREHGGAALYIKDVPPVHYTCVVPLGTIVRDQ